MDYFALSAIPDLHIFYCSELQQYNGINQTGLSLVLISQFISPKASSTDFYPQKGNAGVSTSNCKKTRDVP